MKWFEQFRKIWVMKFSQLDKVLSNLKNNRR